MSDETSDETSELPPESVDVILQKPILDCQEGTCSKASTMVSVAIGPERSGFIATVFLCDEHAKEQADHIVEDLKFTSLGGGFYQNALLSRGPDEGESH